MPFIDGFTHYSDLTYKYTTVAGGGSTLSGASYGRSGFRVADLGTIGKRTHKALDFSPDPQVWFGCDIWIGATAGDGVTLTVTTASNGDLGTVRLEAGGIVTTIGAETVTDTLTLPTEDWTYLSVRAGSTTISGLRHYFLQTALNGTTVRTFIATATYSGSLRNIDSWTLAGTNCVGSHLREDIQIHTPITVLTLYPDTQFDTANYPTSVQWAPGSNGNAALVDGTLAGTSDNITAGPLLLGTGFTYRDIYTLDASPLSNYDEGDFPVTILQTCSHSQYVNSGSADDDLRTDVYYDESNFRADTIIPTIGATPGFFIRTRTSTTSAANSAWSFTNIAASAFGPHADINNVESDYIGVDQFVIEVALLGRATPIARPVRGGFAWIF